MNRTLKVRVDRLRFHRERLNVPMWQDAYDYWQGADKQEDSPEHEIHRIWCIQHAAKLVKGKG